MTISQLECFVEAASTHSFTLAAKKLYISQPNLSTSIESLEEELHILLFHRTNKGVILTEDGIELLAYAKDILNQMNTIENYYKTRKELHILNISCQPMSPIYNAIREFDNLLENQNCQICVHETNREDAMNDVIVNKSEIGIHVISSYDPIRFHDRLKNNHLQFIELDEQPAIVFFCKDSPIAKLEQINYKTLEPYQRIIFNIDNFTDNSLDLSKNLIRTNSITLTKEILKNPNYYLIQTIWEKDFFLDDYLLYKTLDEPSVKVKLGYCYHKNRTFTKQMESFLKLLNNYF